MTFFSNHKPFNILFTGGEPLITPSIDNIFKSFVEFGHLISLQSNFKEHIDSFVNSVPPERTGWILTTFHSVQLRHFKRFQENVSFVKSKGYPIVVKLVLDEIMMTNFLEIYDTLKSNNIGIILSPLIYFPPNSKPMPKTYTAQEWSFIAPRVTLLSSWLYFAGGFNSYGIQCNAGHSIFYIRVSDGSINGCAHSFPLNIGNIYSNRFSPLKGLISCKLRQCICDFHYYSGIISGVNDSPDFQKLLKGETRNVPFSAYLDWIAQMRIEPVIKLENYLADGLVRLKNE
jgi:hypothetical protein